MYIYTYFCIYIYIYIGQVDGPEGGAHLLPLCRQLRAGHGRQDSAKGGAVETGCSDLYDVIH